MPVAILPDGDTDDDDEQQSQDKGEHNTQNDLLNSGQQPVHYKETTEVTTAHKNNKQGYTGFVFR